MTDQVQSQGFGVNVWWTVPESAVDGKRAQEVLSAHGFNEKVMPLPSRLAEVSRAAYSFQDRRSKENRRVTERAVENNGSVVYGILDREQEGDQVAFEQHTTVRLSKHDGSVSAEGSLQDQFHKALMGLEGKVTDQDVRYFLRRVIRMCYGVAKRPSGGIYFVPEQYRAKIEAAQAALDEMGIGSKIYVEPIVNCVETRSNVWDSVESALEEQIAEAVAAVGRVERRVSAIRNQQAQIEGARELLGVYQNLLGQEAKYEGIAEKIEAALRTVNEKMEELTTAQAQAKSAPVKSKSGVSVPDAAVRVLQQVGKPMSCRELVNVAIQQGLYQTDSENPANAFNTVLLRAIKLGEKRIQRIGRGVYSLAA